jgi:hypothetical protein
MVSFLFWPVREMSLCCVNTFVCAGVPVAQIKNIASAEVVTPSILAL